MMKKYFRFLWRNLRSPSTFLSLSKGLTRGLFYIIWFRVTRRNVIIKFPFFCHTKVEISGPGRVFVDRFCSVWMNTFEHLVIMTLTPEAEVWVGRNCTLGGLTVRCHGKVVIGDNVLTAANLIQDVPICSGILNDELDQKPIIIGNDVWLGGQSLILAESVIGDGSVIGVNGLLYGDLVGADCLATGNPVFRPLPIDKIIGMRGGVV